MSGARVEYRCSYCLTTDKARPGCLPRGWRACGPSEKGTRYPLTGTHYYCNVNCMLGWSEQHVKDLQAKENH